MQVASNEIQMKSQLGPIARDHMMYILRRRGRLQTSFARKAALYVRVAEWPCNNPLAASPIGPSIKHLRLLSRISSLEVFRRKMLHPEGFKNSGTCPQATAHGQSIALVCTCIPGTAGSGSNTGTSMPLKPWRREQ